MTEQVEASVNQRDSKGRYIKGHDGQWKPGQSGNPAGPPKDPGITAIQRGMLDTPCPYDNHSPQRTWRQWLAEKGLLQASEKEMALEHLKDRLEGKVTERIDATVLVTKTAVFHMESEDGRS